MNIFVEAKPRSKKPYIRKIDDNHIVIAVKDPPSQGKANKAVIEAVAKHFGIVRSNVTIVSGINSKHKIINVR